MEMMYEIVAKELQATQLDHYHPRDYLNFYCLGNREPAGDETVQYSALFVWGWRMGFVRMVGFQGLGMERSKRFMIYVHAKGMVVDDEYVLVGSANINQRSMAGSRDTEIAMGGCQPHYTWAAKERRRHPRGQVYGYRMSLWAEHLGGVEGWFEEAERLDCVRKVNEIAEENWRRFAGEGFQGLKGHLLRYPVEVSLQGKVGSLWGHEQFPDVGGKVLGSRTTLPDALTT